MPFKEGALYYESGLRRDDGGTSKGAFGRAVRNMSEMEYDAIVKAGFVQTLIESNFEVSEGAEKTEGLDEEAKNFERPIIEMVVKRAFRDAAFSMSVKSAYANTCAMNGLKIING